MQREERQPAAAWTSEPSRLRGVALAHRRKETCVNVLYVFLSDTRVLNFGFLCRKTAQQNAYHAGILCDTKFVTKNGSGVTAIFATIPSMVIIFLSGSRRSREFWEKIGWRMAFRLHIY